MLPQWNNDCSGCEGGSGVQSQPKLVDSKGPVLQTSVQQRSLCIFLFQCRFLWDHSNSEFNVALILDEMRSAFVKCVNATCSLSSSNTTCCMKMRLACMTNSRGQPTHHKLNWSTSRKTFQSLILMYHLVRVLSLTAPVSLFCRQTISCYYGINKTHTVAFSYNPRLNEPKAEVGFGQLMVQMRLAQGKVE